MEAMILLAAISLVVGFVVGVLSGLLGIGGGVFLVPIFKLGYLMEPMMCTATSLFTIIPTSISGAISRIRNKTCIPKLGIAAGLGGACMSPIGVWLATLSPEWAIMGVAALVLGYSAFTMFRKALAAPKKPKDPAPSSRPERGAEKAASENLAIASTVESEGADSEVVPSIGGRQLLIFFFIGMVAGLASGYVGVGGGFIMVPLMLSLVGISMKQASGTSLIAVMLLAIPGTIEQGLLGNIDYMAGIAVAVGSIPGAVIGARLVRLVPERTLRFIFGGFLIVAAVVLVLNEVGVL